MPVLKINGARLKNTVYALGSGQLIKTRYPAYTSTGLLLNRSGLILPYYHILQVFRSMAATGPRTSMAAAMLTLRSTRKLSIHPVDSREIAPSLMFVEISMQGAEEVVAVVWMPALRRIPHHLLRR